MDIRNEKKRIVNICMISDDNYVMPTCVAIQSLIESKDEDCEYHIYIIASSLSSETENLFKKQEKDGIKIDVIRENAAERFEGYHTFDENAICVASISALLKFIIPDLLPDLDKVLYLDGDLIVKESLVTLYNKDIESYYVAAAIDSGAMYYRHEYVRKVKHYFNSGVMLLNLKKIREDGMVEKLLETKRELADASLMDQNVFNLVFDGHVRLLSIRYNFMPVSLYRANEKWNIETVNHVYRTDYQSKKQLYEDAAIIHYSSKEKPWKSLDGACASDWISVYLKTPIEHSLLDMDSSAEGIGISVIMPCYNVENYLHQTIGSILDQTYKNYELICLDDGSTDNTLSILQKYANDHDNIQVISHSNHGQGWERNQGIQLAKGKYIYYMDSDDFLHQECFRRIFACAEENQLDLLFFEGTSFFESNRLEKKFPQYKNLYNRKNVYPQVYTGEELYVNLRKDGAFIVSPCLQLVRREYLIENSIAFPEIPMMEDMLYVFDVILHAQRVKCITDILFYRRVRSNSTMTMNRNPERIHALAIIIQETLKVFAEYPLDTPMHGAIASQLNGYFKLLYEAYEGLDEQQLQTIRKELTDSENELLSTAVLIRSMKKDIPNKNIAVSKKAADRELAMRIISSGNNMNKDSGSYQKGVADTRKTKTYLIGRIVTWIPKQIRSFVRTMKKYGIKVTLGKAYQKLKKLPKEIYVFINVWAKKTT